VKPEIRYTRTHDGISIAYWTVGEGPPLVHLGWGELSHCQLEWEIPLTRSWYERLARRRMLVRYDHRGSGLSDRNVRSFRLEEFAADLAAVVDALGLRRFSLLCPYSGGLTAIAYTAANPERVSNLVFWCGYARPDDYQHTPGARAEKALSGKDWHIYSETVSRLVVGWSRGELAQVVAAYIREAVDESVLPDIFHGFRTDAGHLLDRINCPALVMHRKDYRFPGVEAARYLASRLSHSRLMLFDGDIGVPFPDQMEDIAQAIDSFLAESDQPELSTGLTAREAEVLRLVALGRSNRQIAEELTISVNTADRHVSNILTKIGASNRAEAASFAVRNRLA
jgi:pimeloyl-ACP methyl ester carboxylesterase